MDFELTDRCKELRERLLVRAGEQATRPAPAPPAWNWADAARATWEVFEQAAGARGPAIP